MNSWGSRATRLSEPDEELLREGLSHGPDTVVVVSRDDIVALRDALLAEHLRPVVRLVVTIFDQSTAREIAKAVPDCTGGGRGRASG